MMHRIYSLLCCGFFCLLLTPSYSAETAGPVENTGMKPVADAEGVHVPGFKFENKGQKSGPWKAEWISAGNTPQRAIFRKVVSLEEAPKQVAAWMSADMRYRLWVNGRLVSRGPADIGRDYAGGSTERWFYDSRDLTPFFSKGRNVIAAEIFRNGPGGVSRKKTAFLFEAQAGPLTIKSDATWKMFLSNGDLPGWQAPDFDDSAWNTAQVEQNVWEPIVASEIPPLMEARYPVKSIEGLPDNKIMTKDGSFKVVFDRVLSGFPQVKVKGGKGATVELKAHGAASFALKGGEAVLEAPFMTEIVPAFTVTLKNVTEPVEILDAGAVFTSQPVDYRGSFSCSDDYLNQLWKVSRWAVQICLQTHHLDSPNHQEPISDPGDYLIEAMVNNYAFAQPWLARQDVRKFAWVLKNEKYLNFHISYSIGWLQMLMDYYDYTGDRKLVEEMAPYVHELLDTYATWRGKNGILSEAPNYMFMDWVTIEGFGCHHPPAVIGQGYLTAFYFHGLKMASRVAVMMGDKARVEKYAKLRGEIAEAFNRELWVADKGMYRDGKPFQTSVKPGKWLPADKNIETFSPHVNLLAVLYDLAPKDRHAAIVEKVMEQKPLNTQPWFMHWVFQSLDHAGLFEKYAVPQMRRWKIVPETQSFKEMWNGGDLSHGWCSTPLVQMSQRILGVSPASPGFKTILIRPEISGLTWAKGSVPTPDGDVAVSWKCSDDKLQLDVTIPEGSEADIVLPGKTEHVKSGKHSLESSYKRVELAGPQEPDQPVKKTEREQKKESKNKGVKEKQKGAASKDIQVDDLDADIVKENLLAGNLARAEDHCSHPGGGNNPGALYNGTMHNGSGGLDTRDDGKTFRGYGAGDWLVFNFKKPCNLTEIRTFSAHQDKRAGQSYTVLAATSAAPDKFVKIGSGEKSSTGGAVELRVPVKAEGVVAVRFEFNTSVADFNVYREINILGEVK